MNPPQSNLADMAESQTKQYPAPQAGESETSHSLMLQMIGSGKRVLEFGCASGYMSAMMASAGCRVTAVEIDPVAADAARAHCEDVVVADLDIRPVVDILPATPFDVAVFGDVLEHLRNPWRLLDDTRKFLGPNGFAVISIPNIAHGAVRLSLLEGNFEYSELGLLDDTHLRFFTLRSVRELCMRAGYRIVDIQRTKVPLFHPTNLVPPIREEHFEAALVEKVRRDPEHDTLQFVIRAVPLGDDEKFSSLLAEFFRLEAAITESADRESALQSRFKENDALRHAQHLEARDALAVEHAALEAERQALTAEHAALESERAESAALRDALKAIRSELETVRNSLESTHATLDAERRDAEARRASYQAEAARRGELETLLTQAGDEREVLRAALLETREELEKAQVRRRDPAIEERAAALDLENMRLRADADRVRATYGEALERFVHFLDRELAVTRSRTIEIDAAIRAIQASPVWALKGRLSKLLRRRA